MTRTEPRAYDGPYPKWRNGRNNGGLEAVLGEMSGALIAVIEDGGIAAEQDRHGQVADSEIRIPSPCTSTSLPLTGRDPCGTESRFAIPPRGGSP